jgi:pimeloyl-ACP methyl ester carboxylesterase
MAWADLSDVRLYYEIIGEGEPLLLIPGLGATCRLWDPVIPDLARHFTLILLDNRDVGRSVRKARKAAPNLSYLAADVAELMDELQLDRCHVMGVSLGGAIAQRFAIEHRSRLDRLVLVSCTDKFSPYLWQIAGLLGQTLRRLPKEAFVRMMEVLGTAPEYLDENAELCEQRAVAKARLKIPARAIGNQLKALARSELGESSDVISAPTLVIAGEFDAIIPSCYAKQMADKIPGSRYVLINGAGHNPLADFPERAAPRVVQFLKSKQSELVGWEPAEQGNHDDNGRHVPRENGASAGSAASRNGATSRSATEVRVTG